MPKRKAGSLGIGADPQGPGAGAVVAWLPPLPQLIQRLRPLPTPCPPPSASGLPGSPHPWPRLGRPPEAPAPGAFRRAPAGAWAQALLQLLTRPEGGPGTAIVAAHTSADIAPGGRPPGRADAALTLPYSRGDRALAIRIAQIKDLTTAALERLRARTRTVEGAKVLTSQEDTWALLARAAGFQDPWQLHPLLLETVAAILRDAGYRSVHLYI